MNPLTPSSTTIFEEFLRELQTLDDFRAEYATRYAFEGLERDDPDVARLIEAMAFYRAKTRASVEHGIRDYQLRALEQLFPYLLTPMPAMGIVRPTLAGNMTEARALPAQAEMSVTSSEKQAQQARVRTFRTTRRLTAFPLHIVDGSVQLTRRRGAATGAEAPSPAAFTLSLEIAPSANGQDSKRYYDDPACSLNALSLYVNPHGDALTALRLHDALRFSCESVVVRAFADGEQRFESASIQARFGDSIENGGESLENPIEATRRAIHFPLAHFFLTIPLLGLPSEWNRLSVEFRLNDAWPEALQVANSSFVLNAVPLENLTRRTAEPIAMDGTALQSLIQAQEQPTHWRARDILGVYATDPDVPGARITLPPRSLLGEGYSTVARGNGTNREVWLENDTVLGVIDAPQTVYVDAEWYDPDPRLPNPREVVVRAETHDLGPLTWSLLEPLRIPYDSPVLADSAMLESLLEMQGEPPGSVRELKSLLKAIGVEQSELFWRIPRYIERLVTGSVPDLREPAATIRNYDVSLARVPPILEPATRLLFSLLPRFLSTWTGEPVVQISVTAASNETTRPWVFEWRTVSHA